MKKKDLIYIPHQDTWTEHFPNPGSNKNDYTLYLSDPQAHKHSHPTNKIRYIISQLIILTLYTSSLILVSYTYRIILRYI